MPFRDFYGFQQLPFAKGIAPKDVYPSSGHQELVARLTFALQYRLPALVTGDVGTGKSTSVRAFLSSLDPNVYPVAYLPNPHLNAQALYREILEAFHLEPAFLLVQLRPQLRIILDDLARRDRHPIVIVDEAHLLPAVLLHQLRSCLCRRQTGPPQS
ncbi:MAG: ExeA family protein [Anaerolineae bacterium]